MEKPRRNASLAAKTSARTAAVQLLYRVMITGETLRPSVLEQDYAQYIEDHQAHRREAALPHVPPNRAYLRKLLDGVAEHGKLLDELIDARLDEGWKRERMSPLLLSILTFGVYELDAHRNIPAHVLLDEYTTLTQRFCDAHEVGFVHALLAKVAKDFRTDDNG